MTNATVQSRFVITIDDSDDDLTQCAGSPSSKEADHDADPEVQLMCVATPLSPSADFSDIEIVYQRRATDRESTSSIDPVVFADDVAVVGERNTIRAASFYPHFWHMCEASEPCDKCFCFVCDIPFDQCTNWKNHKLANDTFLWQNLRKVTFQKRESSKTAPNRSSQSSRSFGNDRTNRA